MSNPTSPAVQAKKLRMLLPSLNGRAERTVREQLDLLYKEYPELKPELQKKPVVVKHQPATPKSDIKPKATTPKAAKSKPKYVKKRSDYKVQGHGNHQFVMRVLGTLDQKNLYLDDGKTVIPIYYKNEQHKKWVKKNPEKTKNIYVTAYPVVHQGKIIRAAICFSNDTGEEFIVAAGFLYPDRLCLQIQRKEELYRVDPHTFSELPTDANKKGYYSLTLERDGDLLKVAAAKLIESKKETQENKQKSKPSKS